MIIIHLLILFQSMRSHSKHLDNLKLSINLNLIETKSYLANENTPIWIARGTLLDSINSQKIMNELGRFTTFQDLDTSSALVYFHKRQEFDGTIDHRYYIKRLSIYDKNKELRVKKTGPVAARPISGHYFNRKPLKRIDQMLFIKFPQKNDKNLSYVFELNTTSVNDDDHQNNFYIETMVIINYDMAEELQEGSNDRYIPIVSYLLTLFNSVDMLYSKIQNLNIKFNIAGIIIGNHRESFSNLIKCYRQINSRNIKIHGSRILNYMNAYCTINSTENYLKTFWKLIPRESYDIAIFLTKYGLYVNEYDVKTKRIELIKLGGSARRYPTSGYHRYKVQGTMYVPSASITDLENFSSFPIIAHEIAHMFGVKHDDTPVKKNGVCSAKIMKTTIGYCEICLSWSDTSKNLIYKFFRSPDGCAFINRPRSLQISGPQQLWTIDQQCQCYSHKQIQKDMNRIQMYPNISCDTNLQCKDRNNLSIEAPIPMDGTPCGRNKVCWNKGCKEIVN